MAGIKLLRKAPEDLNYIINELLKPEIRGVMFDDFVGMNDIQLMLCDPLCLVYGIFEKGHPVPIGCVIVENIRAFRGCELHVAIFKPENRNLKKIQAVADQVKMDLMVRWNLHYAEARALSTNLAAKHVLEKLGFKKVGTKPEHIISAGQYADVDEYVLILNGDKLLDLSGAIPKK